MQKPTILVIDDEQNILELIRYNLETNGFSVHTATTVEQGLTFLASEQCALILLDVMLPDIDGITALKKLRTWEKTKDTPIMMLTAKAEEIDKIIGLELGADDYVTKPFSVKELIARINAVLRRHTRSDEVGSKEQASTAAVLVYKHLKLHLESYKVTCNDTQLELTHKEFELLKLLMTNKEKVFTREVLLERIWGYEYYGETRTVDVHIRYLRSKLGVYELADAIETVRGVGYRFAKE